MNEIQLVNLLDEWKAEGELDERGRDEHIEIPEFINRAAPYLPKEPVDQFVELANAFLNGTMGLVSSARRGREYENRLWVTMPIDMQLQEPNRFFRVTDNLSKLLHLGRNIPGLVSLKACSSVLCEILKEQPLMKALRLAEADPLECLILMGMIDRHFDGQEYMTLIKIGDAYALPKSYVARLTHRIQSGYCRIVNESFVQASPSSSMHYDLHLLPKTIQLLSNPYEYNE